MWAVRMVVCLEVMLVAVKDEKRVDLMDALMVEYWVWKMVAEKVVLMVGMKVCNLVDSKALMLVGWLASSLAVAMAS